MKWYSVKKYKPVEGSQVFALTSDGQLWIAKFTFDHDVDKDENEPLFVAEINGFFYQQLLISVFLNQWRLTNE